MTRLKYFGIDIEFPYAEPHPSQKLLMANTVRSCRNRENALLESPTGTGKSLALLAASLAFQKSVATGQIDSVYSSQAPLDVRANSAFSIFSAPLKEEENSQPAPDRDVPQIWYTTRTHSQLKQLVAEYKRLPYECQMAILASRKHLCLNPKVASAEDANAKCQQEVDAGQCPYIMRGGIPKAFRPGGPYAKHDIEDLLEYGARKMRCVYHMSLVLLSTAKLVFCPYNHVLDPRVKGTLEISLVGGILIIDEGHNVEDVCQENGSFSATKDDFAFAIKMVKNMTNQGLEVSDDDIMFVISLLGHVANWFGALARGLRFSRTTQHEELDMKKVLLQWDRTMQNWPRAEAAMAAVITAKKDRRHVLPAPVLTLLENLFVVFNLCFSDNMMHCNDYRVAVTTGENENRDTILCALMNPGLIFRCIAREASTVIISSGTLSPLDTFAAELQTKFETTVSAPHIVGKDQVAGFILTNALDGTVFSSAFAHLQTNEADVILGLGHVLELLLPVIPDGVLFFVPSYPFLDKMSTLWKSSGILNNLRHIKPVFFESRNPQKRTYDKYLEAINQQRGGLLIGVCRGKMSEGMDFVDEQARAVFVFGVPYPAYFSTEVKMKREYNDACGGPVTGKMWYEAQAFRALFQAVGRCIRHGGDYGSLILIDSRFPSFVDRFPVWMRQSFRSNLGVSDIKSQLTSFYSEMRTKFPRVVRWQKGSPITYLCKACHHTALDIPSANSTESVYFNRPGFIELTGAGDEPTCIFVSSTTRHTLSATPLSRNDWRPDDRIAYGLISCPCGSVLGAVVRAAQSCDRSLLNGALLLLSRLTPVSSPHEHSRERKPREPRVRERKPREPRVRERKPREPRVRERKPRQRESAQTDKGQQTLKF